MVVKRHSLHLLREVVVAIAIAGVGSGGAAGVGGATDSGINALSEWSGFIECCVDPTVQLQLGQRSFVTSTSGLVEALPLGFHFL